MSSSWRHKMSTGELQRVLAHHGFANPPIIGITPSLPGSRGHDVHEWVSRHPYVEAYVCLDDDDSTMFNSPTRDTMMQTPGTSSRKCEQIELLSALGV
ncbi:MAG: HAD domain-containing protein, partial [Gammaproteobacteria bacterium]